MCELNWRIIMSCCGQCGGEAPGHEAEKQANQVEAKIAEASKDSDQE